LVFFDRGLDKGIERLSLGGGSQGGLYTSYRDPDNKARELGGDAQWALLRKLIEERKPATIGIDISHTHAFSDGLSAGEREQLEAALGPWTSHLVRAENLPLEYMALRLPEMIPTYQHLMKIAHGLITRAFSNEVITPGKTTDDDVAWWLQNQARAMGMDVWFFPSVEVNRQKKEGAVEQHGPVVIERGDQLHCDYGLMAFGLATDTQHVGYVLRQGESDAPVGLLKALENSNRLQDLLMERMRPGRTGNEILTDTLAAAKAAGINGTIYAHAIGDHGHGAGPIVGLYDHQEGVPGRGDVVLLPNTWYSIELQATTPIPEWGHQELSSAQEEDAVLGEDGKIAWVIGRQTKYHLVK
jgi:Xaa-Pro aminopeptidase